MKEGKSMNINCSTTEANTSERLIDRQLSIKWETINWKKVEKEVNLIDYKSGLLRLQSTRNGMKLKGYNTC